MNNRKLIRKIVTKIPRGKIFFSESIRTQYPVKQVRRALTYLAKSGEVVRIIRDVYVRPETNRFFPGVPILPSSNKIVEAISRKTGEIISVHGAVALNQIGLSTQVPVRAIYHTTGRSRYIKINENYKIKLVHINPKKVIMPGTVTCQVVNALWFEGRNFLTPKIVKKIHHRIGDDYFPKVLKHIDKMPAWMRKVFIQYQNMQPDDPLLEEDLDEYY